MTKKEMIIFGEFCRVNTTGEAYDLLEKYPNLLKLTDEDGYNVLMLARFPKIVEVLLNVGIDIHAKNNEGMTALHVWAAYYPDAEAIELLLEHNAEIDTIDSYGQTPLISAFYNNHLEVAEDLVNANAALNIQDINGNTILHFAVDRGKVKFARLLLKHGADTNIQNDRGDTPRSLGLRQHTPSMVKLLNKYNDKNN